MIGGATPDAADLASRWVGGSVLAASDESFGEKEHLLTPGPPAWTPGVYGPRGELVDGWETRRRRDPGDDWVIVRLGTPGVIAEVDVDTSYFTGNHPERCTIEATGREGYPGVAALTGPETRWEALVEGASLAGGGHNLLRVNDLRRWTHLRLRVAPDGGVARLRVYGTVVPDPRLTDGVTVDLAGRESGGAVVAASDEHYSLASVLNRPDRARNMGEGWETRRRRDGGNDWVLIRLGYPGEVSRIVVDTGWYRYNASAAVAVSGGPGREGPWSTLLDRTALLPDTVHDLRAVGSPPVSFVRVEAFPDGGLSRVRVVGRPTPDGRDAAGRRWWTSLPEAQALEVLEGSGIVGTAASALVADRTSSQRLPPEIARVVLGDQGDSPSSPAAVPPSSASCSPAPMPGSVAVMSAERSGSYHG